MPDTYDVVNSERVTVTVASGDVRDGQDSLIRAKPSGVEFYVTIIVDEATFADPDRLERAIDGVAAPYSDYFNADVAYPGVVDLTTYQDFDKNNNSISVLQVTVSSNDGEARTTVDAPITDAIPDRFSALVDPVRASLNRLGTTGPLTIPPVP